MTIRLWLSTILLGALALPGHQAVAQALPDLVLPTIARDNVTMDTQTLAVGGQLDLVARNTGNGDAGAFDILVFEDENLNQVYDPGTDEILGNGSVAGLLAGEEVAVALAIAGTLKFRDALIYAIADPDGAVAESNEDNNQVDTSELSFFIPPPGAFSPVLEWEWTGSPVESTFNQPIVTPIVANLTDDNNDGVINEDDVPDILFQTSNRLDGGLCSGGSILRAISGADGSSVFDVTDPSLRVLPCDPVAVGDLDGDGLVEIVASQSNRLVIFENDGSFKAFSDPVSNQNIVGGPSIADINRDGVPEIIVGGSVLDNNGLLLFDIIDRGNGNFGALSTVADLNLQGDLEIVSGFRAYQSDGSVFYNVSSTGGYPAIGNFDNDANPEVVVVANGAVYLLEHTGVFKWGPVAIPGGGRGGPPTVADFDNDGEPEIGVAGAGRYAVFDTDGSLLWAAVTRDNSSNITGSSVFDFEGDGSAEVVYNDELFLRVYRGTDGAVLFQVPSSSCTGTEYPTIVDVDNDGRAEIVATRNQICGFGPQRGVAVFGDADNNWVPTRRIWNQHAYYITNVDEDGNVPANPPNNWQVNGLNNFRLNTFAPGEGSAIGIPDLTASYLRCENGQAVARIGNGGGAAVAAGVPVAVYDGDPLGAGTLLDTLLTSIGLSPDEFEDLALPINPADAMEAWVFVDPADDILEGSEDNNIAGADLPACEITGIDDLTGRPKRTKFSLRWSPADGASGYNVYRSDAPGGPYSLIAGNHQSSYATYLDDGLATGAVYYYVVTYLRDGVESVPSNEVEARMEERRSR
jgi:hypothetical protein